MTTAPAFRAQTVWNACVPTTVAMLAHANPADVLATARRTGIWDPAIGQDHRTIPRLAAAYGVRLGEWARTMPAEPGTYLLGVDASVLYRLGTPRSPHAVAAVVRPDGRVTIYDGRNDGPVVKMASTVAQSVILACPVLD